MKIRTEQDVLQLDATIKQKLGVDILKYKNEGVTKNFIELLLFPQYVLNWTIRPVLVSWRWS